VRCGNIQAALASVQRDVPCGLTWPALCASYRLLTVPAVRLSSTQVLQAATQWLWALAAEPSSNTMHMCSIEAAHSRRRRCTAG
jgi:hypothetical protein